MNVSACGYYKWITKEKNNKRRAHTRYSEDISSTYVSGKFNPHKAKKIFSSSAQREAEKYFVKVVKEKFRNLRTSKAPDVLSIREEAIEKVFTKFRNHSDIRPIMVYVKNLWMTFDEHLYSTRSMKEKVNRHIDFIIKNTSEEREEKLLAEGATPEEVYQIFRTVQGYNLYQISLLSKRGGAALEIYVRKCPCIIKVKEETVICKLSTT